MEKYHPTIQESLKFISGSSEIEGEYSPEAKRDHLQAWEYARGWGNWTTLSKILECHKLLQTNLRPDIAGKLREVPVWVGQNETPNPASVPHLLDEWIENYGSMNRIQDFQNVEDAIERAHIQFEKIHPFEDGNGRVGRCIMNWHRTMAGLPLFIVEPGESQMAYYKWFK